MPRMFDTHPYDQQGDLNEESSIESSLCSDQEDIDSDDDIDSATDHRTNAFHNSALDTDSCESPFMSDSDMELSESLNDDDDDDDEEDDACKPGDGGLFGRFTPMLNSNARLGSSMTFTPMARITEHTREASTSCRTTTIRGEESMSMRLMTPSKRYKRNKLGLSPQKTPRMGKGGDTGEPLLESPVIDISEGMSLANKLSQLAKQKGLELPESTFVGHD